MIYWAYASTYNLVGPYLLMGDFLKSKTSDVQVYVIMLVVMNLES